MRARSAQRELKSRFGRELATNALAGFASMLEFYECVRAEDVDIDSDGDMLLFQWGTYDWGEGPRFEVDVTRQLIVGGREDDDIWQLHLTYSTSPTVETAALGNGNLWCPNPSELPAFREQVTNQAAVIAIAGCVEPRVELLFECVG